MPMCAHDCECDWCVLGHMAEHDSFKAKLEQLVNEFKNTPEFQAIQERNKKVRLAHTDDQ
jgi:hypothetical protein